MTDQADTGPIAHRIEGGHWLVFDEKRKSGGPVTGCHCGIRADLDADAGWGDSVLDHFEAVVRAETADEVRALRAERDRAFTERDIADATRIRLAAELAAARDQIAVVTNERNRLAIIARQLMHGLTPKAEAERLIAAALSQSGQPTKETP